MSLFPDAMTRKTLELRDMLASGVELWDFEYPSFYQGDKKKEFEQKVIEHFYMRQIGAETVGRFKHFFRRTMREIMPLYIQRYESVELMKDPEIRPLDNYNMIEELRGSNSTTGSENRNSTGSGSEGAVQAENDTPQGQLSWPRSTDESPVIDYASRVEQGRKNSTASEDSSAFSSTSGINTHTLTRRGNIGVTTYADLLEGYRKTFLNIDMEIIEELEICFLGVY